jgi:prophage DNA circulation protein
MTWREDLRRVKLADGRRLIGASFRGVPFFVAVAERGGGRRVVVHEFPLREDPFVEDLGRKARTLPVEGYVIGDDYLVRRDELLAALEDVEGPGQLVHPYHGIRRALCTSLNVRESITDGGMAVFTLEFVEAPAQAVTPSEEIDQPEQVSGAADVGLAANKSQFLETYDVTEMPGFALETARDAVTAMSEDLREALAPVIESTQELALVDAQLQLITAQASSLVRQPDNVLDAFVTALRSLQETSLSAPAAVMDALIEAYGVQFGPLPPATTGTRVREIANREALAAALRRIMAIEAARLAPRVAYQSIEQAKIARDAVADILEAEAETAGDTSYPALVQLRADLLRAVPGDSVFAREIVATRRVSIPSILLAYQLYGSVDQEQDLIDRNSISHPCFVFGDLKALSDV